MLLLKGPAGVLSPSSSPVLTTVPLTRTSANRSSFNPESAVFGRPTQSFAGESDVRNLPDGVIVGVGVFVGVLVGVFVGVGVGVLVGALVAVTVGVLVGGPGVAVGVGVRVTVGVGVGPEPPHEANLKLPILVRQL